MQIERVLVIHRKSLYKLYVQEHEEPAVKRALQRGDPMAKRLRLAHDVHMASEESVKTTLEALGLKYVFRWRANARTAHNYDLVISLGGDGTLLDTSHNILDDTPLVGINSDPQRSVGALCCGRARDLLRLIRDLRSGKLRPQIRARLRVRVEGKEVLRPALNDMLLSHVCPAGLTRFGFCIVPAGKAEKVRPGARGVSFDQIRGSGLWISTATGSTAAIRSAGGRVMRRRSRRLQFLVREPYVPMGKAPPGRLKGFVSPGEAIVLFSRVRRSRIWVDGPHLKKKVDYGDQIIVDHDPVPLRLVHRE